MSNATMLGAVTNRLRFNLLYHPNERLSFSITYNFLPRIQDPWLFANQPVFVAIDPFGYRFADLDARLYPTENDRVRSFAIFQNLDRALITLQPPSADIYIGRQAIAWGSARVINPTDVIAPFAFEELDSEERIGVDAVRVRVPIGFMGEIDTGYIVGRDFAFDKSAFFVRDKFYLLQTNVSLLLLGFRQNLLVGLDIARSVGGAGFWFEGAYVAAGTFDHDKVGNEKDYLRATTGLDYSFSGKTYGFVEYHFNQAGATTPESYLTNLSRPAYSDGAVYLLGRHYLVPGLTYQITALTTLSAQALFNLSDASMLLSPHIEYNIAENIYVSAGAFFGIGKSPEIGLENTRSPAIKFHSEFGGYPNIYFSSFRIYF